MELVGPARSLVRFSPSPNKKCWGFPFLSRPADSLLHFLASNFLFLAVLLDLEGMIQDVDVNCSPFQRVFVFVFGAVVDIDVDVDAEDDVDVDVDVDGDGDGDDCLGLLASLVSDFLASLDSLRAVAATAAAKGDGDAGGDIMCWDSKSSSRKRTNG
jgi:hypothetical protein